MKNRILYHIFGFLFFIPTLFLFLNQIDVILKIHESKTWNKVNVKIIDYETKITKSGKSSLKKIHVKYEYKVNGEIISGNKLEFSKLSTNFKNERISRQNSLLKNIEYVLVNSKDKTESVLDNSLPLEELNFTILFTTFFGFIGVFWFFSIFNNIFKTETGQKIILIFPFLFLSILPISSFTLFNEIGFKTIIMNSTIIITLIFWYISSLKYVIINKKTKVKI